MTDAPVLKATPEGPTIEVAGRGLYAPGTPRTSAERRARGAHIPERSIVLVPSVGLGYGLEALLEGCPPTSHVLCVEADQSLFALAAASGLLPRHPRLSIYRTDDPRMVAALARRLGLEGYRRCRLVNLCGGYQLYRAVYDAMFATLERLLAEYWQNRMTSIHMGALWVKNCLENLGLVPGSVGLETLAGPGPVYVVGAGPSLDDAVGTLRAARPPGRILAVDTALPILAAHGIRPDLIFILEAQHANLYDFLPPPDRSTPIIADLTAHPASLRLFDGPRSLVLTAFRDLALFRRLESSGLRPRSLRPLGSVGVAACAVALELTTEEVVTVGLDFAYHGDRTHAAGAPLHTLALGRASRLDPAVSFQYRAIHRRPLRPRGSWATDAVLDSYRVSLEDLAAGCGRILRLGESGELETWGDGDPVPVTPPPLPEPAAGADAVSRRYAEELDLIESALSSLSSTAPDPGALAAVDYAFVHFPESAAGDAPRGPLTAGYVARARQALTVYRGRLRRLAARLPG